MELPQAVLIDGCSNANLVTRNFLNNSIKNYKIVGSVASKVHQTMSDAEERVYEIVQLDVNIGNLKISSNFGISEKEGSFYNIIIGLKTQHDHRNIVDTMDKYLSFKNKENKLVPLVPIEDISMFHSQALLCYLYDDNFSIYANTIFTTIKDDKRTIIESVIEDMDVQEDIIK